MALLTRRSTPMDTRLASLLGMDEGTLIAHIEREKRRGELIAERRRHLLGTLGSGALAVRPDALQALTVQQEADTTAQQVATARKGSTPAPAPVAAPPLRRGSLGFASSAYVDEAGTPRLRVLVESELRDEDLPGMRRRAGPIAMLEASPDELRALVASGRAVRMELVRPVRAALDQCGPDIGLPSDGGRGTARPAGRGVIVGIVDFGLDFHHSDLRRPDGRTRLLALHDAEQGREWSAAEIDADFASGKPYSVVGHRWDRQGRHQGSLENPGGDLWMRHGTHMALVAAGNGQSGGPAGLAPEAELLFFSLDSTVPMAGQQDAWGQAGFDRVIEGVSWILGHARRRGAPVVINLSLEDRTGPHDGTSLHQAFLDGLLDAPGQVLVVAAGNGNDAGAYRRTRLQGGKAQLRLQIDPAALGDEGFELWLDSLKRVAVELRSPAGDRLRLAANEGQAMGKLGQGERVVEAQIVRVLRPDRGDQAIRINLLVPEGSMGLPDGEWTVALSDGDKATVHAWLERCNGGLVAWLDATVDRGTVSDLATHPAMLVVGSVTKALQVHPRTIPAHSGRGPTRDGRPLPHLLAPGVAIRLGEAHERASLGTAAGKEYLLCSGSGSSIAAAMVSGATAVLMECRGQPERPAWLSTRQVREILMRTARRPDGADSGRPGRPQRPVLAEDPGVLDLVAACTARQGADLWMRAFPGDTGSVPSAELFAWRSPDIEPSEDGQGGLRIAVTVHNRSSVEVRAAQVGLAWSPALTAPSASGSALAEGVLARRLADRRGPLPWLGIGVQADAPAPASIPAGGSARYHFTWRPPRGVDPTRVAWRAELRAPGQKDGISATRHVHYLAAGGSTATLRASLLGTAGRDGLLVHADEGARLVALWVPRHLLRPWQRVDTVQQGGVDPTAVFGVHGAAEARSETDADGTAWIRLAPEGATLRLPSLELPERGLVEVRVEAAGRPGAEVHLAQLRGGEVQGGVSGLFVR